MKNVSGKNYRKNKNTFLGSIMYLSFQKSCWLCDNVEKLCRAGQATHQNIAHAHDAA
jgi:hypothetical protein